MAYVKHGPFTNKKLPAVNAEALNHLEDGIDAAHVSSEGASEAATAAADAAAAAQATADAANIYVNITDPAYGGAVGDGVTDNQPRIMQAIDAITAAGGGTLYVPEGDFLLTTVKSRSGLVWHLSVPSNNIKITGPGTLRTTNPSASIFNLGGSFKAGDNWDLKHYYDFGLGSPTLYAINAASINANSIQLVTAAQAANFSAGAKILIRTGQTFDHGALNTEPDAEINEVVSVDVGTGIVTLKYPLCKPYAQENYIAGSQGASKVGGAGTVAPFGVANVTDRTSENVEIDGITLRGVSYHLIAGGQIDGLTIKNVKAIGSPMMSMGMYRDGLIRNNRNRFSGANNYGITTATTTSDVVIEDNLLVNDAGVNQIHSHEGGSRIKIRRNRILAKPVLIDFNSISIRARGYDILVEGNEIVNSGNIAIFADDSCVGGGAIRDNEVRGSIAGDAIGVTAPNWKIEGNKTAKLQASTYYPAPMQTKPEILSGWLKFNQQEVILGDLPIHSIVTKVTIYVMDFPFNSSGTDQVTVGYDGATNQYVVAQDVSAGFTRIDCPLNGIGPYNQVAGRTAKAYYVNGGTEPTVGQALVVLEYMSVARN